MAGRGPAPAEARRRRNEPTRGDWVDLEPLSARVLPELPDAPNLVIRQKGKEPIILEQDWSPRTLAAWEAWARDPVTGVYGPTELAAIIELAYVMEDYVRGLERPNEVRLRMDGLGLTPKGKRDLRYRNPAPEPPEPEKPSRRGARSSSKRRARLSVVT